MTNKISRLFLWFKTTLTIPRQTGAMDIASWRRWLLNATSFLVVFVTLPFYLLFIFPSEWPHHYPMVCATLFLYALISINILTKSRTLLGKPVLWLISMQLLMAGGFFYWGISFKSMAWLMTTTVLWATYYGVWPAVLSVGISIGSFLILFWVVKPSNATWMALYANPLTEASEYIAVVLWLALATGIVVGLLLQWMDRGLKTELLSRKTLMESEMRYRALFDSDPNGIIVADLTGIVVDVNRTVLQVLGYKRHEIVGRELVKLAIEDHPEHIEQRLTALKSGILGDTPQELKYRTKDGEEGHALARGWLITDERSNPVALGIHLQDISREMSLQTENVMLGQQLQRVQKLEAIGTLAGGIAHDFNNLLSGIIGYAELAQMTLSGREPKTGTYLTRLLEAGQRARELVQQILRFSRQEKSNKSPLSLSAVVKEVIKLLESTLPSTIRIEAQVDKGAMIISADATQIHQVVMNLCTNAYQSMRDHFGTLNITLEKVLLESEKRFMSMAIDAGEYVCLTVSDTGEGIAPDNMDKIFDPYFSTKRTGGGTGLGLSVSVGIVKEHQGLIEAQSTPSNGSSFRVYLPFEQKAAATDAPKQAAYVHTGENERIMVVDDESFFLEIVSEHLATLGYRVEAYGSSIAALGTFRQAPDNYDLIISDQTMPEMTGRQLTSKLKEIRPEIPVILCTGYSDVPSEQEQQNGIASLLMKPVTRKELAEVVFSVLKAKTPA